MKAGKIMVDLPNVAMIGILVVAVGLIAFAVIRGRGQKKK